MEEWKSIEPNTWKPENKEDSIVGVLVRKEEKTPDLSARYYLENEQGNWLVWGSTILDTRMNLVNIGSKVRIIYKGQTKNARNQDLNLYSVDVAVQPTTIRVEKIVSSTQNPEDMG